MAQIKESNDLNHLDPLEVFHLDIVYYMFGNFIPPITIASTLRLVSKTWKNILDSEVLWKNITVSSDLLKHFPLEGQSYFTFYQTHAFLEYPYKIQRGGTYEEEENFVGLNLVTGSPISIYAFRHRQEWAAANITCHRDDKFPVIPQIQQHLDSFKNADSTNVPYWHVFEEAEFSLQDILFSSDSQFFEMESTPHRPPLQTSLWIIHQVLKGLAFLEKKTRFGLNLSNIKISNDGQVKLGGISIAHANNMEWANHGSLAYFMSPEIIKSDMRCIAKSDVWSWGILVLTLLAGKVPLKDLHPMRAIFAIPAGKTPPLQAVTPTPEIKPVLDFLEKSRVFAYAEGDRPDASALLADKFWHREDQELHEKTSRDILKRAVKLFADEAEFRPLTLTDSISSVSSSSSFVNTGSWGRKKGSTLKAVSKNRGFFDPLSFSQSLGKGRGKKVSLLLHDNDSDPEND